MILNHKAAIELLVGRAEGIGFNPFALYNLHALLSDNLLADPAEGGVRAAVSSRSTGRHFTRPAFRNRSEPGSV
jgi:hypothetical protein